MFCFCFQSLASATSRPHKDSLRNTRSLSGTDIAQCIADQNRPAEVQRKGLSGLKE